MKIRSWMKRHGLCPCSWFAKLSNDEKCKLCALIISALSLLSIPTKVCASETVEATPCISETGTNEIAEVVITRIPCPSLLVTRLIESTTGIKIPTPVSAFLANLNADAVRRQAMYGGPLHVFR